MTSLPAHRLTCSGLELAMHCAYPFRLDAERVASDEKWLPNRAMHEAFAATISTRDTACVIHPDLEAQLTPGEIAKVRHVHTAWLADWYEEQGRSGWRAEVAFAFNPFGPEHMELEPKHHRDYSDVPTGWVPGTADIVRNTRWEDDDLDEGSGEAPAAPERLSSVIDIVDWKTGFDPPGARGNLQIAGLGLGAGATRLRGGIAATDEDGVQIEWDTVDGLELEETRERVADIVSAITTAQPRPGPHCRDHFCPSFGVCPATRESLDLVAPEARRRLPIVTRAADIQGPEHAREQYMALREAKALFEHLHKQGFDALLEWADHNGGIPLGNGKTYIRREVSRESIDLTDARAIEVLGRELGDEAFRAAVTHETSKTAIKRAAHLIKAKTGESISNVEKRVLEKLRELGAVRVSVSKQYGEVKLLGEGKESSDA